MGQRSQIYVRLVDKYTQKTCLIARYFQWNFAERMISRARHGIQWIKDHSPYIYAEQEELNRIWDVNFDMHDVVISRDIIEECKQYGKDLLFNNDNNDGKLFVDIIQDKDGNVEKVKYCFTDWDNKYLGGASNYLKWDSQSYRDDVKDNLGLDEDDWKILENNKKWLKSNAKLMTKDELEEFLNYDYDLEDKPLF